MITKGNKVYTSFEEIQAESDAEYNALPWYKKVIDRLDTILLYRLPEKVNFILAPKYKLEKEHREIGMTYWDRPRKFDFDVVYSLPWVIYPQLVRFRRCEKNGVPLLHEIEDHVKGYSDEEHAQILQEWNEIIDKMIFAFAELIHDDAILEEDYGAATDIKIQEGLDLFAKHFRNLWD